MMENNSDNLFNLKTKKNRWVIFYDIREQKRLNKVAKIMESFGIRVQKSVFEVIADIEVINKLRQKIKRVIKDEDYVLYINLCEEDWQKIEKYGQNIGIYEDKDYLIL